MTSARERQIRILIVEDHQMVADGLAALFNCQPDMVAVATVGTVPESIAYAAELRPKVVTLDFSLNGGTGVEAALGIREVHPMAKLVFLTRHDTDAIRVAAIEAGASAFIHKSRAAAEVVAAVRWVARGGTLIRHPKVETLGHERGGGVGQVEILTKREKEVLRLMGIGASSRDIAGGLGISYHTVRTHVRSLGWKLDAQSKLQTIVKARRLALIE